MNRIEEFRGMLGLSRPELASRVGVDRTMMWRYEKNLSTPSDRIKVRIAGVLNRSVEEIFFSQPVVLDATIIPESVGAESGAPGVVPEAARGVGGHYEG